MKILITSDNHLGYKETDPIRADDSFNTFEEILKIAKEENVDFMLQSGDLFHENKPSQNTYNKTMRLLKKYCLGTSLSNINSNMPLNFKDPNVEIALPIFSIHGNHDDPSGFNNVSPLDVLQASGFINYFGKVEDVDNIELSPILIEENKKIALYGLGYIKDRRLYKTFYKKRVNYKRPPGDDWFYILMVHQNRVLREGEYLPEDFIDPLFDVVIYGHEHESLKIRHKNFDVIQCGSTVRTSFCEGECHEKYAYILGLSEGSLIRRIMLQTVRPLILSTIKINSIQPELQIRNKIKEMIQSCKQKSASPGYLIPLIRLRIEASADFEFSKHKITQLLDGNVANPSEVLRIIRKNNQKTTSEAKVTIQKMEIAEIYSEILRHMPLKALVQHNVVESLIDFVEKDSKDAFANLVKDNVSCIKKFIKMEDVLSENLEDAIRNVRANLIKEDCAENTLLKIDNDFEILTASECANVKIDEDIIKTIPAPKDSTYFCPSTLISTSKIEHDDYKFVEEKVKNEGDKKLIDTTKIEMSGKNEHKRLKRQSESDDELLNFFNC